MRFPLLICLLCALCVLFPVLCAQGAQVGVEGVKRFPNYNAAHADDLSTLPYTFNICNGVWDELSTGHARDFYWAYTDCWEKDIRAASEGGLDSSFADNVDLFFLATHGNNWGDSVRVFYDSTQEWWISDSTKWRLGNGDLEWIAFYSCDTLPFGEIWDTCIQFFYGLHEVLGAYDTLWYGITTDEVGEDFAENLKDGWRVYTAWLYGLEDWWCDQHPLVACAEQEETWDGGDIDWPNTRIERDHYHGHGTVVSDLPHDQIYYFSYYWLEP